MLKYAQKKNISLWPTLIAIFRPSILLAGGHHSLTHIYLAFLYDSLLLYAEPQMSKLEIGRTFFSPQLSHHGPLLRIACQFVAHEDCLPRAPINCPPQKLDAPLSDDLRHYWIEGNLSGHCSLCRSSLSKLTILYGFRCAYCVIKVCPGCFPRVQHNACDEGEMASLKLGPGNLITHATDIVKKWTISIPEDRRPLMVFINKKVRSHFAQS